MHCYRQAVHILHNRRCESPTSCIVIYGIISYRHPLIYLVGVNISYKNAQLHHPTITINTSTLLTPNAPNMNTNTQTTGTNAGNGDMLDKGVDFVSKKAGHQQVRITIIVALSLRCLTFVMLSPLLESLYNRENQRWRKDRFQEIGRYGFYYFLML